MNLLNSKCASFCPTLARTPLKPACCLKTSVIETVARVLADYPDIPLILDPVMVAKGRRGLVAAGRRRCADTVADSTRAAANAECAGGGAFGART